MEKPLSIAAVCGWALPPEWFGDVVRQYFPESTVKVLYPLNPEDSGEAEQLLQSCADLYIGYSLGSLWLLLHQQLLPETSTKAVLAPVLDFVQERNMGGKTEETKLKYLLRKMRRNLEDRSPLLEFYSDCEIELPERHLDKTPSWPALLNGLEFLLTQSVSGKQTDNFIAVVGENDILLDAMILKRYIPHLQIVPNAGHAPHPLLKNLAERMTR